MMVLRTIEMVDSGKERECITNRDCEKASPFRKVLVGVLRVAVRAFSRIMHGARACSGRLEKDLRFKAAIMTSIRIY